MGRFERLRAVVSDRFGRKRYASNETADTDPQLEEYASAQQWADTTKPSVSDRAKGKKRFLVSFGYLGLLGLLSVAYYSSVYMPGFYRNPTVHEVLKWLIVVPVCTIAGMNIMRSRIADTDRLTLFSEGEVKTFFGKYGRDSAGNRVFYPVKGYDLFGLRGRRLTLADLPDDIAMQHAKNDRDPDEDAVIRVEDATAADQETALGRNMVVLSDGLKFDENGRESDVYAAPADLADPKVVERFKQTVTDLRNRVSDLEDQLGAARRERNEWKAKYRKRRDEILQDHIESVGDTNEAVAEVMVSSRRGQNRNSDTESSKESANT